MYYSFYHKLNAAYFSYIVAGIKHKDQKFDNRKPAPLSE